MSLRDRLSSWRTGSMPDDQVSRLNEQVFDLLGDMTRVVAENQRLTHDLNHVRADRDRLLAFYQLDVADLDRLRAFNHPSSWTPEFGGNE